MATGPCPSPELVRQVRNALAHLYDYAYLQNHPLAAMIDATSSLDQLTRAQKLRRLLLECIDALCPRERQAAPPDAARAHAILTYRYVDGVAMEEIAGKRGLSERQAYRELEKGIEAVASLLQDRMGRASGEPSGAEDDPLQAAHAEVARLHSAVNLESLDLLAILEGVLDLLAPIAERTGVRTVVESPGPWPAVVADRVMLRQALLSLLTHTLNTTAHGDLAISISHHPGWAVIVIQESATPTRTRPLATPAASESSVGLAVAQALVEAQGGHLEAEQMEGRWRGRVSLRTACSATILAIDDNHDLVALLQRYLAGHDVRVIGATDSEQALRLAAEVHPQLITLDVMMPGHDGWDLLQHLKQSPATAQVPIIVCSVLEERELAQAMGASDYITKPVQQVELLEVFRRWVGPLRPAS